MMTKAFVRSLILLGWIALSVSSWAPLASAAEQPRPLRKLNISAADIKDLIASSRAHSDALAVMVVQSDEVLVKAVATNPGAIGLVDVYSITSAISVLRIDGKLPLEPGYALHGN